MTCDDVRDKCLIDCVLSVYLREIGEVSTVIMAHIQNLGWFLMAYAACMVLFLFSATSAPVEQPARLIMIPVPILRLS